MELIKIYALIDPVTCKIRYIGRTKASLPMRLSQHIFRARRSGKKTHKNAWISSLLRINSKPKIKLLTTVEGWEQSHVIERCLISKYRDRLVNHDDRGEGQKNKILSDEYKKSISNTLKKGYSSGRIPHPRNRPVFVYDYAGNYLFSFKSGSEAGDTLHIPKASVRKACRGEKKGISGFQFRYEKFERIEKISIKIMKNRTRLVPHQKETSD